MRLHRTFMILVAAGTTCAGLGCTNDPTADAVSSEDRRILRALIDIACKLDVDRIVISDRPVVPRETLPREIVPDETYRQNLRFRLDLDRRIARKARWPRQQICPAVRVVADSDLTAALAQEKQTPPTWEHFSSVFGGARTLMRVSLPVYSSDGKHAVVYTTSTCPYTCGAGFYQELDKTYGQWRITASINAWRSGSSSVATIPSKQ